MDFLDLIYLWQETLKEGNGFKCQFKFRVEKYHCTVIHKNNEVYMLIGLDSWNLDDICCEVHINGRQSTFNWKESSDEINMYVFEITSRMTYMLEKINRLN